MRMRSNSGFSLIEVTVGMALVAGMALTVSTMIQWQSKASRGIASILDRNDINMRLSTWAGDSAMCSKMFGATPYNYTPAQNPGSVAPTLNLNQVFDGASGLSKFLKADPTHTSFDPNLAVFVDSITVESEDGLPPVSGGGKLAYKSLLRIKMKKRQPGLKYQANGKENINVGGDTLKDVVVPIVLQIDSATQLLTSCSTSGSAVVPDCSASGDGFAAVYDSGLGKTVCKKVSCGSGKFPAGTNTDGTLACCSIGDHFAGTLNGTAVCCGSGSFLKPNGVCSSSSESSCTADVMTPASANRQSLFAKSTNPDGSTYCCEHIWKRQSNSGGSTDAQCSAEKVMQDPSAAIESGYSLQGFGMMKIAGGVNQIHAEMDGHSKDVTAEANCCKMINTPPINVITMDCSGQPYTVLDASNHCVFDPSACTAAGKFVLDGNSCLDNSQECFYASAPWYGHTCTSCIPGETFVPIGASNGKCVPDPHLCGGGEHWDGFQCTI